MPKTQTQPLPYPSQDSLQAQITVVRASMQHWTLNMQEGVTSPERAAVALMQHLELLARLEPSIPQDVAPASMG